MITTNEPLPWDTDDYNAWRVFLTTRTGSRLIPKLLESVPMLLSKGDVNEILIRSGEVRGWTAAAQAMLLLTAPEPEPKKPADQYPPLTDDAAWNDGKKTS